MSHVTKRDPRYSKTLLPDGRVMYTYPRPDGAGVHKRYYRPVPDSERKYRKHGPVKTTAVLPDEQRVMPETQLSARHFDLSKRARQGWETRRARAASAPAGSDPRR